MPPSEPVSRASVDNARRAGSDRNRTLLAAFAWALALGISTIAIPLLALAGGYDASGVGFLVAITAATQIAVRFTLPWLLARIEDRFLIAAAGIATASAFAMLLASTALPVFLVAQVLIGVGRGVIWTSSQTHISRQSDESIESLVDLHMAGTLGTLAGPPLAGMLAGLNLLLAPTAAAISVIASVMLALTLHPLPTFDRRRPTGTVRLLGRPGVPLASWASFVGGGWFALLGSYVPVILAVNGYGPQAIGWMIAASEGAGTVALPVLRRARAEWLGRILLPSSLVAVLAVVAIAVAPADTAIYALVLAAGGTAAAAGGGLSPALASLSVEPGERGDALAISGMFRALALLGMPMVAALLVPVVTLGPAVAVAGGALGLPGLLAVRLWRRPTMVGP